MFRATVCFAGVLLVFAASVGADSPGDKSAVAPAARFDTVVREDLFAGFAGDNEALARGIKSCEDALKADPKNAEAKMWRGAARVFQGGQAFQAKNPAEGIKLFTAGQKEMDEAVKMDPKNPGVRIPRASVLIQAANGMPPAMAKPLLEKVRDDFEMIYALHKDSLDKIGTHPNGELRMGLADVYRRLGESEKSKAQLKAVSKELPNTKYGKRAAEWLAAEPETKLSHTCIGCHTK